jgi:hypothetical protein
MSSVTPAAAATPVAMTTGSRETSTGLATASTKPRWPPAAVVQIAARASAPSPIPVPVNPTATTTFVVPPTTSTSMRPASTKKPVGSWRRAQFVLVKSLSNTTAWLVEGPTPTATRPEPLKVTA